MIGASDRRILGRHLLPHLAPTVLVWAGVAIGANILAEVGLSFLGIGVPGVHTDLGLDALDRLGDDLQSADLQQPDLHALANDRADDDDRPHRSFRSTVSQRACGGPWKPEDNPIRVARYLVVRLLRSVLVLLTMIAITFALYFAIEKQPPVAEFFPAVGHGIQATPQQTQLVRHLFSLDRSKVGLYFDYLWHLARGDIGHQSTIQKGEGCRRRTLVVIYPQIPANALHPLRRRDPRHLARITARRDLGKPTRNPGPTAASRSSRYSSSASTR